MNIWVYSDESGVLDKNHYKFFVYGGIVFLDKETKEICERKYIHAERDLRKKTCTPNGTEMKACRLRPKEKGKLFRSLNQYIKFGIVIDQSQVHYQIFNGKKDKQRFLDFAYKISLKRLFESLIQEKRIIPGDVERIFVFVDEHTTATNGHYELKECLEAEFKNGTFNYNYNKFFPPVFPELNELNLQYCDSSKKVMIRAADIIANRIYHHAVSNQLGDLQEKVHIAKFP